MIPRKFVQLFTILMAFACIAMMFPTQAEAGRFGLFGNSGCASGNCSSSDYSATETAVEPELASIVPHGVRWQITESRAVRRQEVMLTQQSRTSAASNLVLAYRSGKIDPTKSGRRLAARR